MPTATGRASQPYVEVFVPRQSLGRRSVGAKPSACCDLSSIAMHLRLRFVMLQTCCCSTARIGREDDWDWWGSDDWNQGCFWLSHNRSYVKYRRGFSISEDVSVIVFFRVALLQIIGVRFQTALNVIGSRVLRRYYNLQVFTKCESQLVVGNNRKVSSFGEL